MTQSENNTTHSEIYSAKSLQVADKSLQGVSNLLFHLVSGVQQVTFLAPARGFWNILLFQKSSLCIVEFANQKENITESQRFLSPVNNGEAITIISPAHAGKLLVLFIPENDLPETILQALIKKNHEQFIENKKDSRISLALANIQELHRDEDYINKLKLQVLIVELFIYQMEEILAKTNHDSSVIKKNHYEKIQLVKNLIDADYSQNHTIADLAKKVGTNEQYLKKYFKLCFGKTIMNYITQMKMEKAKKLILDGNYRISDVANMTGYKHATHFTTAFKKYYGIIPNSLRYTILSVQMGVPYSFEFLHFNLF